MRPRLVQSACHAVVTEQGQRAASRVTRNLLERQVSPRDAGRSALLQGGDLRRE